MKVIYIDCSAGLSGSALLGALVELGANPEFLIEKIKSIVPIPFQLKFHKKHINDTAATAIELEVEAEQEVVPTTVTVSRLTAEVTEGDKLGEKLTSFFDRFIQAQARVLGFPTSKMLMPEADIFKMTIIATGFFLALDQLDINKVISSPLPVGFYLSSNNSSPLLLELARGAAIKQYRGRSVPVTPLGVALLTCLADGYGPLPEILLTKTSYGLASDDPLENARVRIMYGTAKNRETPHDCPETITSVETAIDDMNPEFFPFLVERLLAGGATDAHLTPIYMKKGRPAHLLTVLCTRSRLEDVLNIIFKETTTLGVRIREEERRILPRYFFKVSTPYGEVTVKAGCFVEDDPPVQYAPEFEDCKKLALQLDVPIKEVYAAAQRAAHDYIKKHNP